MADTIMGLNPTNRCAGKQAAAARGIALDEGDACNVHARQ